ncbi:hypothetical protein WDW89_00615 [Deltaproteobacteria bacterium TL4]
MGRMVVILMMGLTPLITLGGCSGDTCSSSDPSCQKEAVAEMSVSPSKTVHVGDQAVFNASASEYDSIRWSLNGKNLSSCNGKPYCSLTFETAGVYVVTVIVSTDASTGSTLTGKSGNTDRESIEITVT